VIARLKNKHKYKFAVLMKKRGKEVLDEKI